VVAIVDADLGGVRIARRILRAVPFAELIDVGTWEHPTSASFEPGGVPTRGLHLLVEDVLVGAFASAVLERGHPVEQEFATLAIVDWLLSA
jgi:hypothetical protein